MAATMPKTVPWLDAPAQLSSSVTQVLSQLCVQRDVPPLCVHLEAGSDDES